jgi:hypothetical protein
MVGIEDYRPFLDRFAGVCAVCADDFETEVKIIHHGHTETLVTLALVVCFVVIGVPLDFLSLDENTYK